MKIAVLGAGGGLGRNVVDAGLAAGHDVVALVRDAAKAQLPPAVTTVLGDAANVDDLVRAMTGADATMFCVNPALATWLTAFPPLLDAAIEGARRSGTRLLFPANVWVFGPGRAGDLVDERRAASPTSQRGAMRATLEQRLRTAGIRHAVVRLPEFYGPSVVTLTAYPFRAALAGKRAMWPGKLDAQVELVYMPDAGKALVAVGTAADGDGEVFHLSGARTTPRQFIERVFAAAGAKPRAFGVPRFALAAAGLFDRTIRAVADIGHLWTAPILLDGAKYRARFGGLPLTSLDEAVAATMAWHRARPDLTLQ